MIVLEYWVALLTMAIIAQNKNGKSVWKLSVCQNDFGYFSRKSVNLIDKESIDMSA